MTLLGFTIKELREMDWKKFFRRFYQKAVSEEDLMGESAQVAFYFAFALFPLLLFLISLFGFLLHSADELRDELFFYFRQVMPGAASDLVQTTIQEVTQNSSGGKLTLGILAALYSASAGIDGIRVALNGVYNLTETRPWWKTKLTSVSLTLGLGILVTIVLGIIFYGGKFINTILGWVNLPISSPIILGILQGIVVFITLVSIFAFLYNWLPNHKEYKWVWVTPGAIIGIVLWLLLSYGFSLYLSYFNTYDKTYGSLGAMIILMLWLLLTALVILVGGTINAVMQEFSDPETAEAAVKKAEAQETVENPDDRAKPDEGSDKKAEVATTLNQKSEGENIEKENQTVKSAAVKPAIVEHSPEKKSKLKLFAGLLIGFVEYIKKR
jgi:membrane protein